jgi:WD40 repeat protein
MSAALAQPPDRPFLRIEAGMHTAGIRRIDVDAQGRFLVTASHDKTARVWSLASGELLKVLRPPLGSGNEGRLDAVAIFPDGGSVTTAGWSPDTDNDIYLFDSASGRLQQRISGLPNVINHLAYAPDGHYLAATLKGINGIRVYETRNYAEIARDVDYGDDSYWAEFDRRGRLVASSLDGYVRLYDAKFKRIAKRKAPGGEKPFAVQFSPDDALVAVAFSDSTVVNVLDGEDLSLRYSPDTSGVAKGNLSNNLSKVAWSRDGQRLYAGGLYGDSSGIHPILQWPQAGRGPPTRLPAATDNIAALGRIGDVRQVLAGGLPPTLELLSPPESQQRAPDFTLQVKITPTTGGVGRMVYRVNGVVVGDLTARPVDISVPYHRRPFTLAPGRYVISVTVFNAQNTVESTPIETIVHVQADERRPSLYVMTLGVSNYSDRALQLRYAADDAKALADTLRRQGERLFTKVEVTSLLDRDGTVGKLEVAFRDLAGKVQAHDVFILYLAGHGMTLDGEYHFIPADVIYENAQALRTGSVQQERLQRWLGAIQAQKSLVLLDTCASEAFVTALSGTVTQLASARDLSEKGAIDKLMRATGRAVIAASTERQFALEGHSGHGVFTYALLQGLRGEADAQGDRDGAITMDELSTYVTKEVPRISLQR